MAKKIQQTMDKGKIEWIPAYIRISRNEISDKLSKYACSNAESIYATYDQGTGAKDQR
jgi:hypothetical protein